MQSLCSVSLKRAHRLVLTFLICIVVEGTERATCEESATDLLHSDAVRTKERPQDSNHPSLKFSVELYGGKKLITAPNVSAHDSCCCICIANPKSGMQHHEVAFISIGASPFSVKGDKSSQSNRADPGECVVKVDLHTGQFVRTNYHQRRPNQMVCSPNGQYVGMVSREGWVPSLSKVRKLDGGNGDLAVGTMKASVWETEPFRPVWESRYSASHRKEGRPEFSRSSNSSLQPGLPSWEKGMEQIENSGLRIGFSNCSRYFALLDERKGLEILRLADGHQLNCCPATSDHRPAAFFFEGESEVVSVILTDNRVRRFCLRTGAEIESHATNLPWEARFQQGDFNRRIQFAISHADGGLAVLMPYHELRILRLGGPSSPWKNFADLSPFGESSVCRIDFSTNLKRIGVGYIPHHQSCRHEEHVEAYEVIDTATSKVLQRIVGQALYDARRVNGRLGLSSIDEEWIVVPRSFATCLSSDGEHLYYATATEANKGTGP